MLVGFSRHGKGDGGRAVGYLCRREGREGHEPVVLHGDAMLVAQRIEQNPNEWKYTSGVLSFAPEDGVVDGVIEQDLIVSFEEVAFAGIEPDNRPEGLWVRHSHAGHHEMHFLYPRQLNDGRAYNMRPPGDVKRWDAFRDVWNYSKGWADPDDPERARALKLPNHLLKVMKAEGKSKDDIREIVHDWALERIQAGLIGNRDELIAQLKEEGFDVPRAGKDYITITAGDRAEGREHRGVTGKAERIRCRGGIFSESFLSVGAIAGELKERAAAYRRNDTGRVAAAEARLDGFNQTRAASNRERYYRAEEVPATGLEAGMDHTGDLRSWLGTGRDCGELGLDGVSDQSVKRGADRISTGAECPGEGETIAERIRAVSSPEWRGMGAGEIGGGLDRSDGVERNIGDICRGIGEEGGLDDGNDREAQQQGTETAFKHSRGAGERIDAAGAWLDWASGAVDGFCGGLQGIVRGRYRAINKREQAITQLIARARAAHQSLTEGYKELRRVIVPLVQQKMAERSQQLQLQREKSKEIDLGL